MADQLAADFGDWSPLLQRWAASAAGRATLAAVDARVAAGATVYPAQVFRALSLTSIAATRVVILGQDPYHGPGQAEGLAFSVPKGQKVPPSLRNIFKEQQRDLGLVQPGKGSLLPWTAQGVLLLNTSLTVEDGQAGSHAKLGWHVLTDEIFKTLLQDEAPKVFMLWGAHAQARVPEEACSGRHLVLQSNHPSPLSASRPPVPFVGCGHFSAADRFLSARGRGPVAWQLP
ncbi:MAG: uracil-DNA glycosylase [Rubrivivax sp.]|nr:uracil-DNA glycosylase [Rubrivivax sp.]MDP3611289.1 uracil-DNA glycosylase [Rubrivivax sp.]